MAENKETSTEQPPQPKRPTITLPPRPSMDTLFTGGFSPGPMTLVYNFFGDNNAYPDSDYRSFTQLLAGAMASPLASTPRPPLFADRPVNHEGDGAGGTEKNFGFKQSRPMNLVVARSPMFTVPPGLSPSGLLNSPGFFPPQSPFGMSHQQALAQVTAEAVLAQSHMHMQAQHQPSSVAGPVVSSTHHSFFNHDEALQQQQMPLSTSDPQGSTIESLEISHSDRKIQPPISIDKPGDDGFNWRKYGQKPIKGCEYPRSYYKCTQPNCPVKKKVERSSEGLITEIIYKGQHNHEKPQQSRRGKDGTDVDGNINPPSKPEFSLQASAGNSNNSREDVPAHAFLGRELESAPAAAAPSPGPSDSEGAGYAETREEERDDNEPNPKRRNTNEGASSVVVSEKTVTEPKIIVQTRSEVDLLDDGYRWRKYGQKVVKGNPHPRSYYKCTSAGCNVRKHVERASTDAKAVITTYEGKHNHNVPAAKNSSHNAANNSATQSKQHNSLLNRIDFRNNDQRAAVLRLKEEHVRL
ncbi:WRKY transcription factor 3 [Tripterygium wilfordii]|uniref:WRKY transcription factor 3 n=1 Tax=Tripterygium wilfordii TaxID=458696 RepID=A0A7J7CNT0_TRIWF|nr:probable WRKY transcription factor 4 [Tripterygium wilfordii]KAF5735566.1 WRKY transcription factor 3 [Tripterygium wilfordii]